MQISSVNDSLCFKLHLATRMMTGLYKTYLADMNLTFPQFLVLGLLWEQDNQTIKSLGQKLHLDSGTLTPLVKRLEKAKYLCRRRDKTDERSNTISLTKQGLALKKEGVVAAEKFYQSLALKEREQEQLKKLLDNWLIQQGFMEKT